VEVSTVATAVTAALDESLEHAQRLLAEAETAQELAERALAAAASSPSCWTAPGGWSRCRAAA
jgi:hypothetical protein